MFKSVKDSIFLFYIKPQRLQCYRGTRRGCISFLFYIKPQPWWLSVYYCSSCISFLFYIKPQLLSFDDKTPPVVFHFFSTSNHNVISLFLAAMNVVFHFFSTSNHNSSTPLAFLPWLYFISFLHQTTTLRIFAEPCIKLYFISFLHQTTTLVVS